MRVVANLEVQVGGFAFGGYAQEIINIHCGVCPQVGVGIITPMDTLRKMTEVMDLWKLVWRGRPRPRGLPLRARILNPLTQRARTRQGSFDCVCPAPWAGRTSLRMTAAFLGGRAQLS